MKKEVEKKKGKEFEKEMGKKIGKEESGGSRKRREGEE